MTMSIPHPYEEGMARRWIGTHAELFELGEMAVFAVVRPSPEALVGAVSLTLEATHGCAEMGYWIGRPFWNRGYASEAAGAVVDFGFRELGLGRIHASHFGCNPASGRVMEKVGMVREGRLRRHRKKDGRFQDLVLFGILREEWKPTSDR